MLMIIPLEEGGRISSGLFSGGFKLKMGKFLTEIRPFFCQKKKKKKISTFCHITGHNPAITYSVLISYCFALHPYDREYSEIFTFVAEAIFCQIYIVLVLMK